MSQMLFLNSCPFPEMLAVNLSMDIFRSCNTKRKSLHVAFVQKYGDFIVMCVLFFSHNNIHKNVTRL
jgi:hypothetical protein